MAHREGTPVQGLNLYKKKGLGPRERFYGPGARKRKKQKNFENRAKVRSIATEQQ